MIPTSAAFQAAQAAPSSEPRFSLKAILTDIAAASMGSTVTSTGDFSADFPASGTIDGKLHHLNFGPAVTAEDRIGRSGWKSPSMALTNAISGRAAWATGGSFVFPMSDHVEATMTFPTYNEDFFFRAAGNLVPQDGWAAVGAGGTFTVGIPPAFIGRQLEGQALRVYATGTSRIRRAIAPGPVQAMSFMFAVQAPGLGGVNTYVEWILRDNAAGVDRFCLRLLSNGIIVGGLPAAPTFLDNFETWELQKVRRVSFQWDATVPLAAPVKVWLEVADGESRQVYDTVLDMTNIDTLDHSTAKATSGNMDVWSDDYRIGQEFYDGVAPTQDNVIDWGVAPVGTRAELTFVGDDDRLERYIGGAFYATRNRVSARSLRIAGPLNLLIGQTFTPTEDASCGGVRMALLRSGAAVGAQIWVELRTTIAGAPTSTVLARSAAVIMSAVPAAWTLVEFSFPSPWRLQAGTVYALVVNGNNVPGAGGFIQVGNDNSPPTYAGGIGYYSDDGLIWIATPLEDLVFEFITRLGAEIDADLGAMDSSVSLGESASSYHVAQGFTVPVAVRMRHFRIRIRRHELGVFAPADRFRLSLRAEGAANVCSNTVLAEGYEYDPNLVTWGGTEGAPVWNTYQVSLLQDYEFMPGVRYFLVLSPSWAAHATNHLDVGIDASAPVYAGGTLNQGTSAAVPVWTSDPGKDVVFQALAVHRPFVRFEAAFSSDGIGYSAFQTVYDNAPRTGSGTSVPIVVQALRYWKVRANIRYRPQPAYPSLPWTPRLFSYSVKLGFATAPALTIAFGQSRVVSRIEVVAHPIERGASALELQTSTDGIVFTTLTAFSSLEARKRGGGATVSQVGGRIETDGDYLAADLAADVSITHLRVRILDNIDEWARVIEVRAARVVDFGERVLGDPSISGVADFRQRRFSSVQLGLSLDNTDGMLSPLGTVSPYADQLGEGVKLIFSSGYREAVDLVNHGEFFVDNWKEDPKTCIVNVAARDLCSLADTRITVRAKTDKRSWEVIEYFMNLANIPSQWLKIDRTANRIKYVVPSEPNAWQESQKVAEAAAFADLFADRDGYMVFRGNGTSCGDTGAPVEAGALPGTAVTNGPAAYWKGKLYCLSSGNIGSGTAVNLRLIEYDPIPGTWRVVGLVDTYANPGDIQPHPGGYCFSNGDELVILYGTLAAATLVSRMAVWTGTGSTFTLRGEWPGTLFYVLPSAQAEAIAQVGRFLYVSSQVATTKYVTEIDMTSAYVRTFQSAAGANGRPSGFVLESGKLVLAHSHQVGGVSGYGPLQIVEFDPIAGTFTDRVVIDPGTVGFASGMCATGRGYVYLVNQRNTVTPFASGAEIPARITKVDVSSWTATQYDALFSDARVSYIADQQAIAYADGVIVGGATQAESLRRLILWDEDSGLGNSPGSYTLGSSRMLGFMTIALGGQSFAYGVVDNTRVCEYQLRKRRPAQDVPVIDLHSGPDGLLLGASLDHGTDTGGDNRIINVATVKSEPLIDFASEVVWTADRLPWTTAIGKLVFRVKLKDPAITLVPSITTTPGGAATVTTDGDTVQPEVTVTVTAGCTITALSISGRPLRKAAALVASTVGTARSVEKHGVRHELVANDYIYDLLAAAPMAAFLVIAFQNKKARADNVSAMMLTNLERLDLIRLRDDRTGLNALFYVTGLRHGYRSHKSSLTVLQK